MSLVSPALAGEFFSTSVTWKSVTPPFFLYSILYFFLTFLNIFFFNVDHFLSPY